MKYTKLILNDDRCSACYKKLVKILEALGLSVIFYNGYGHPRIKMENPPKMVLDKLVKYYAHQDVDNWEDLVFDLEVYDENWKYIKKHISNCCMGYPC